MNRTDMRETIWRPAGLSLLTALAWGCDFSVTNPGPVQDEFLDNPVAQPALVNGVEKGLSQILGLMAHHVGSVTREITASGLVGGGSFGIPANIRVGILDDEETEPHWEGAQQTRWLAEDAIRRIEAAGGAATVDLARAHLYAGYANRLLGENFCDAVIDGGPAEPYSVYFDRAESQLTDAITVATDVGRADLATAARAGRASVRASLEDWPGAVADAATVPDGFVFQARYFTTELDQYNVLAYANFNSPHRSNSVVNTFYENYYTASNDPRTPWISDPDFPFGGPAPEGQVVWLPPQKFTALDQPLNLSSGREMRLLEAEAALIGGDWQQALQVINDRRLALGITDQTATNVDETWAVLKRERGIELWLEARRLGDMRRWRAASRPGPDEDMAGRSLCFPIARSEKATNPNL